jgi:GNAT superfamily N-acetyltransferase
VHRFLSEVSYWARGRSLDAVERSLAGSVVIGAYTPDGTQAGLARVVTDGATFAWLCDVFVLPAHRGHGLGKRLVAAALAHPDVAGVGRVMLKTDDAHGLYAPYGFRPVGDPERWMERRQR